MDVEHALLIAAGGTFLGLSALAASQATRNPLAVPFGIFSGTLFAYAMLESLGYMLQHAAGGRVPPWDWLESAVAPLTTPTLLAFLLAFVGSSRRLRWLVVASCLYNSLLAATCFLPFVAPAWSSYPGGPRWATAMLIGQVSLVPALIGLVLHGRATTEPAERARTQLLTGAMVIGIGGAASDLLRIAGLPIHPEISGPAILLAALLTAAVTFRFRLLEDSRATLALNAMVLGGLAVAANITVFYMVGDRPALLLLGTLTVLLLALAGARSVYGSYVLGRERTADLATLGRLSAQMAHDIRNPLAALKGAAQYLEEEGRRGAFPERAAPFVELLLGETERLERVVERYRRLGRAEAHPRPVEVPPLVARCAAGARLGQPRLASGDAELVTSVGPGLEGTRLSLDPDLLEAAIDNLIRNALEADARRVELTARLHRRRLEIGVDDDGTGMDPRTRERARGDFFTTKAEGTGLGLAFVRRAAKAHGGHLRLTSALGRGTEVTLALPAAGSGETRRGRRER